MARRAARGWSGARARATGSGRRLPGRWTCAFRSCGKGPAFRAFWRRMANKARPAVIQQASLQGLATRPVDDRGDGHGRPFERPAAAAVRGARRAGQRRSWRGRSKAAGPRAGSTPPMGKSAVMAAAYRLPSLSLSASMQTAGVKGKAMDIGPARRRRSGPRASLPRRRGVQRAVSAAQEAIKCKSLDLIHRTMSDFAIHLTADIIGDADPLLSMTALRLSTPVSRRNALAFGSLRESNLIAASHWRQRLIRCLKRVMQEV